MNNSLPPDVVQRSYFIENCHKNSVMEWCNSTMGIRARYPQGRWTYFPFYHIGDKDCIRVVLYHTDDQAAFSLVWGKYIIEQKVD